MYTYNSNHSISLRASDDPLKISPACSDLFRLAATRSEQQSASSIPIIIRAGTNQILEKKDVDLSQWSEATGDYTGEYYSPEDVASLSLLMDPTITEAANEQTWAAVCIAKPGVFKAMFCHASITIGIIKSVFKDIDCTKYFSNLPSGVTHGHPQGQSLWAHGAALNTIMDSGNYTCECVVNDGIPSLTANYTFHDSLSVPFFTETKDADNKVIKTESL